jgi:DNA topoisomerase-1
MPIHVPGLRYVTDAAPGYRRRRRGRGFSYEDTDGQMIREPDVIARIQALAIPPAWTDVWICPSPAGHLQATGRDARGRKQYRYHARWRARRDAAKFDRMMAFGRALPRIRARCRRDVARPGLPREKVLAAVVMLLGSTLIRVGNEDYARLNRSFGLTTLKDRHAAVSGTRIRFRFRGKSGREHEVALADRRLARIVRRCQDLPGQELFQYVDGSGAVRDVVSQDVNDYLRAISGGDFTAKDFRTWAGTVLAFRALRMTEADDDSPTQRAITAAMRDAADELGNTPAVARGSYVHPAILDAFADGSLGDTVAEVSTVDDDARHPPDRAEERAVLALLERHRQAHAAG